MAARGRTKGFKMTDEHRIKIQNSKIFSNLVKYAEGDDEVISKAQADVGLALLRKVMPDLSSVAISNEDDKPFKTEETGKGLSRLLAKIESIEERSAEAG